MRSVRQALPATAELQPKIVRPYNTQLFGNGESFFGGISHEAHLTPAFRIALIARRAMIGVEMSAGDLAAKRGNGVPVTDSELDSHALTIIGFLYNRVIAGAAPALRKHIGLGVTEARVVLLVGAAGTTMANRLAKKLGLDKAAISRAISRLIELDLLESHRDPGNAASNLLTLTESGLHCCKMIADFTFAREKFLLDVLTDEEQQQFIKCLCKILTNVEPLNELVAQGHFWDG